MSTCMSRRWEEWMKRDLMEMNYKNWKWMELVQNHVRWQAWNSWRRNFHSYRSTRTILDQLLKEDPVLWGYNSSITFIKMFHKANIRCSQSSISCCKILWTSLFAQATESANKVPDTMKCGLLVLQGVKSMCLITAPVHAVIAFLQIIKSASQ